MVLPRRPSHRRCGPVAGVARKGLSGAVEIDGAEYMFSLISSLFPMPLLFRFFFCSVFAFCPVVLVHKRSTRRIWPLWCNGGMESRTSGAVHAEGAHGGATS
ncbi:hypothetical protein CXB51_027923 [Gossypium anomalum]|uniref:Uncharacterized protein n=1 Tax=Gossypium anomalum TaxID=47600 RepID=A0A8J6CKA2_9ROSI|nr:hypothetical protein CXB51_027923 [Gossypium anomalum]